MNADSILKLVESYIVILIPITLGITEIVKRVLPESILLKWTPLISMAIGVLSSMLVVGVTKNGILVGIIVGLSASGLWSTVTNPFKKVQ